MDFNLDQALLIGSILIFFSLIAGKTSYRFGVPVLILFLLIGMLAGSEGLVGIAFDNANWAQAMGIVALNFILFSGGLDTDWKSIRPVLGPGLTLATLGVVLTALSIGLFVWLLTDFSLLEGLLLGSIVSSTDSASVFSILRSKSLSLKGTLRPTLELESGSNDPMAYILTLTFIQMMLVPETGIFIQIPRLIWQIVLGLGLGYSVGWLGKAVFNRIRLDYEGMYPVLMIAIQFFSFSLTQFLGGNGFLAVYVTAVYLGNQNLYHKHQIVKWFDGFAWLMQIVLFLTLGLLVFPSQLLPVMGVSLLISAFMILIARPFSVFLSLLPFRIPFREKSFISWVGLRGAVPIVFATYPLIAGIEKAQLIFNIVFFISLTSLLIQGTTLPIAAKWLKLLLPEDIKRPDPDQLDELKSAMVEIRLSAASYAAGRRVLDLKFPKTALITFIQREGNYITPNGATVLKPGDKLFILMQDASSLEAIYASLGITENDGAILE